MVKVAVLALQGAFAKHCEAVALCGHTPVVTRSASELARCDALILPGGESTVISKLLVSNGLVEPIRGFIASQAPVFGTCAGMIVLSQPKPLEQGIRFSAIHIEVDRNGYGSQIASFEVPVTVLALGSKPFQSVFIRAPKVTRVGEHVRVLASHDGTPVLCQENNVLTASFHPELTDDIRLHEYFLRQ